MKKIIIASSQFNYKFGNNIQIPFSVAQLVAYVKSKPELGSNFEFMKTCGFTSKIDDYIQDCKNCDIFLFFPMGLENIGKISFESNDPE